MNIQTNIKIIPLTFIQIFYSTSIVPFPLQSLINLKVLTHEFTFIISLILLFGDGAIC